MATKIQLRRDTAANWSSANPTLSEGELGYETDTRKFKIGNGTDAWTTLGYSSEGFETIADGTSGQVLTTDGFGNYAFQDLALTDYYNKSALDAGALDNRYFTETELNAGTLDNRYFTETETNNLLNDKSDKATTYTKTEVDGLIPDITGKADTTYVDTQVGVKWTEDSAKITNWDTAHGWGDHSVEGYLTTHQDISGKLDTTVFTASIADYSTTAEMNTAIGTATTDMATETWVGNQAYLTTHQDISGKADVSHTHEMFEVLNLNSTLTLKADVATTYTKTEVDNAITAASPSGYNNTDWDTAFGWGDHSTEGYLVASDITGKADLGVSYTKAEADANFLTSETPETVTSLSLAANVLTYTDEDGTQTTMDLSLYLDDTNLARIVDGTLDPVTNIATFERDDSSSFTIDLSNLAQDLTPYSTTAQMNILLADKADQATTYTKTEVDGLIPDITGKADVATTYTKTEVDGLIPDISVKADQATTYTKTEVDGLIPDISGKADSSYVNVQLSGKADAPTTYTKTEVDSLVAGVSPTGYNNTDWDTAFGWGDHSTEGYLVASDITGKADTATTYTKTEVDGLIPDVTGKADTATTYTKTEVDTAVALKANQATTYDITSVDGLLAAKADTATTYTKTEVDGLVSGGGYGDSDVDTHVNVAAAPGGLETNVLTWTGADYEWKTLKQLFDDYQVAHVPLTPSAGLTMTVAYTGDPVKIYAQAVGEDIVVDWGDGSTSTVAAGTTNNGSYTLDHSYASNGNYDVEFFGKGHLRLGYDNTTEHDWTDIKYWGTEFAPTSCQNMFDGCDNIGVTSATDAADFDLSNVTTMANMFYKATNFNGDINGWDTSNVTNTSNMFVEATSFNQDLLGWDTSNISRMDYMFYFATSFNGDISSWSLSSINSFAYMFYNATSFNQDLSGWDTSRILQSSSHSNFDTGATAWQSSYKPVWTY